MIAFDLLNAILFKHQYVCVVNVTGADKFAMRKEREQTQIITRFCERGATKSFNFHEVTFNVEKN